MGVRVVVKQKAKHAQQSRKAGSKAHADCRSKTTKAVPVIFCSAWVKERADRAPESRKLPGKVYLEWPTDAEGWARDGGKAVATVSCTISRLGSQQAKGQCWRVSTREPRLPEQATTQAKIPAPLLSLCAGGHLSRQGCPGSPPRSAQRTCKLRQRPCLQAPAHGPPPCQRAPHECVQQGLRPLVRVLRLARGQGFGHFGVVSGARVAGEA